MNHCINDTDGDGICDELEIVGCQDPTAFNYDATATDPGECIEVVFGCTDPTMFNYNPEANVDNGSCIEIIYGCMDPLALNYDEDANTDNGNCIDPVAGCMDVDAYNFEPLANVADNESCLYEAVGCVSGVGEPYGDGFWLNDDCYAWVIEADPYCCEEAWDATCQATYDYCSVTGIESVLAGEDLIVYPNPVGNVLNINQNVDVDVIDSNGRIIVSKTNTNAIDASLWPPGMYMVRIIWNGRVVVNKVVK
jgi:hypothetical protein